MRNPDQAALHQLEALCTQEQPPACMSGCPLHVDGRSLCAALAGDDFDSALTAFRKAVPFPGILSRTCMQHCRDFCRRRDLGDSLMMGALEQAACEYGTPKKTRGFLPKRNHTVAVIGGGLSGLTAALELAKKGCRVTVFEKEERLGGQIWGLELPLDVVEQDFAILKEYPITLRLGEAVENPEMLIAQYDAVYVSWGDCKEQKIQLKSDEDTYESQIEKVFAGGYGIRQQSYDTARSMADGKRAAISIDRCLKQVSMMAGREKEGTYETTLYVNTDSEQVCPPSAESPFSREAAREEAARCLDCKCLECAKACVFLREYKTFPRKYLREVYNNLSIAMGNRHANRMINSCALCGQCAAVCPFGLDVGRVTKEARQIMVDHGKMPASSFEFGLRDMEYADSEELLVHRHQPGFKSSRYLFFPGCQMGASAPELVLRVYEDLCARLPGGVGIYTGCCGIAADWAGEEKQFLTQVENLEEMWNLMGRPEIVTACPTCYKVWKDKISGAATFGIWEVLDTWPAFADRIEACHSRERRPVKIMDACAARGFEVIHESVRHLLGQLGYEQSPQNYEKEKSGCCGFGGLMPVSNRRLAGEMAASQVEEKDSIYLTYCINCRDRYTHAGADSLHLLELLYGGEDAHIPPTWSDRQRRRRWLKKTMLFKLWEEKTEGREEMKLYYGDELREQMEERMILEEDLEDAIRHAEESGEKIEETQLDCFISGRRVGNVYFWVYYRPEQDGYRLLKAYSHRMNFR